MGVKEFCLGWGFPDAASGFQLASKLTVWFIRAQGRSSGLPEVSQRVEHSTGFELSFHLVFKLLLSCLDASQLSTLPLPTDSPGNKLTKPSSQPGTSRLFYHSSSTLNSVGSVKLQSVLKLCCDSTRVGEHKNPFLCPTLPTQHS